MRSLETTFISQFYPRAGRLKSARPSVLHLGPCAGPKTKLDFLFISATFLKSDIFYKYFPSVKKMATITALMTVCEENEVLAMNAMMANSRVSLNGNNNA